MTRRDFVATAALPALAASRHSRARLPIRKAVLFEMLPKSLSIADRFKLAKETGFEATECPTTPDAVARRRKSRRLRNPPGCRFTPS